MSTPPEHWIAVATLLRPQGRRGEILAQPLSDLPSLFVAGRHLHVSAAHDATAGGVLPDGPVVTLESAWAPTGRNSGRLVLKLSHIDSISAAEDLAGRDLLIADRDLPARDADTFLVRDLLGCSLYDHGRPAGEIVNLEFLTTPDGRTRLEEAAPLLVVHTPGPVEATPVLVPFVKAWLQQVDLAGRRVFMTLPEGLFTLTKDASQEPNSQENSSKRTPGD